jgi:hypothetical protein
MPMKALIKDRPSDCDKFRYVGDRWGTFYLNHPPDMRSPFEKIMKRHLEDIGNML